MISRACASACASASGVLHSTDIERKGTWLIECQDSDIVHGTRARPRVIGTYVSRYVRGAYKSTYPALIRAGPQDFKPPIHLTDSDFAVITQVRVIYIYLISAVITQVRHRLPAYPPPISGAPACAVFNGTSVGVSLRVCSRLCARVSAGTSRRPA
jgi:hypothetical protein